MSSWIPSAPRGVRSSFRNKETYVTVDLTGGLGTQIFQTFAAQQFAERTGRTCVFAQEPSKELRELFPTIPAYKGPADTVWKVVQEEPYMWYKYQADFLTKYPGQNIMLKGFFQNKNYFPVLKANIYSEPKLNTFFLHIRLGDFKGTPKEIPFRTYYRRAINQILQVSYKPLFLIFSDEPEEAEAFFKEEVGMNVHYKMSSATSALDVLKEMAGCSGGICANSALSWMGAYFQKTPRQNIFMPSLWMRGLPRKHFNEFYPNWATVVDIRDDERELQVI